MEKMLEMWLNPINLGILIDDLGGKWQTSLGDGSTIIHLKTIFSQVLSGQLFVGWVAGQSFSSHRRLMDAPQPNLRPDIGFRCFIGKQTIWLHSLNTNLRCIQ